MQTKANLQDLFLLRARRDKLPVTMFLMNGFQLRGVITGYDSFVVVLVSDGKQQMIYKHAISTLAPMKPLKAAAATACRKKGNGAAFRCPFFSVNSGSQSKQKEEFLCLSPKTSPKSVARWKPPPSPRDVTQRTSCSAPPQK